ncbi:hypothetical protein [Dermatobacter hominis]|uniref:hypothetical protein n=1 Tax=Dermatobacter hominis TaxID=2884263 RepID=UPI001D0F904C|nr:hypothetical protein [Dermatobacter hominis]UDY37519.1 hypothetical protein LH044_08255 [Dermatobacter hominis]
MRTETGHASASAADLEPSRGDRPTRRAAPLIPLRAAVCFAASAATTLAVSAVAVMTAGGVDRGRGPWPRLPDSTGGWLSVLGRWDAAWYVDVAAHGYPGSSGFASDPRAAAFYPVVPGLLRGVSTITGLPPVAAGVAVGGLCGLAAVAVVWHLTDELAGPAAADRAAAVLAFSPAAFVFVLPYTEGLAIAAAAGALLSARRGRWWVAGALGAVATATRPNTVVIVVALAAAAWVWGRGRRVAWVAPALSTVGVGVTWIALWVRTGTALAWLEAERIGWKEQMDFGRGTGERVWRVVTERSASLAPTGLIDVTVVAGVVLAIVGLVALWRWRPPLPVQLYGVGVIALSATSAVVGPRPRMVLGAFPLAMAVGVVWDGRAHRRIVLVGGVLLVALSWITFTTTAVAP